MCSLVGRHVAHDDIFHSDDGVGTMQLNADFLWDQRGLIDGVWQGADQGDTLEVTNPANGDVLGVTPNMGAEETQRAVDAADRAFQPWSKTTAKSRSQLLYKWYELMLAHQEDLAHIMTLEQGKPLVEARGEVVYAANFLQWFAEEAKRSDGVLIPTHKPDARIIVTRQPIGVIAAIAPWNFPLAMITRKIGPALAAGCTAVIKPSELTPYSAAAMLKLAEQAGIPKGVLNLVIGEPTAIGEVLTKSPKVKKISFTGSTRVGQLLMEQSGQTLKKLSLELGGNAPFIVFDDADVDAAVDGAMASKYRNAGQTCVCANRFYVHDAVHDQFVEKLAAQVQALKVGNGLEEGVTQGPLINDAAVQKVQRHVDDAMSKGATIVVGGKPHAQGGTFYEPTILTGLTADATLSQEETFGPVAGIYRFRSEEEVMALANDTEFGLAAYFYSRDLARVWRVAEALETGIVGVNEGIISTENAPFGGVKSSGMGREGSRFGMEDYMEMKYILMGGLS